MRHHRELLSRLRDEAIADARPVTFFEAVDFVRGYDDACEGALLEGFFEWLKVRGARGGNRGWPGLVEGIAFPRMFGGVDHEPERPTDPASERRAIELLFDLLVEFHDARELTGLAEIFRAYLQKEKQWRR